MTGLRGPRDKTIACVQGDITDSSADAIVNAANNHLWMGSGVAGAIKRKGGDRIELEAMALGPIAVGESVATGAGDLRQKHVIHAAVMGQDLLTDRQKIAAATRSALTLADQIGVTSVALPALGTGVGGFSTDLAAEIMVGIAREFLRDSRSVTRVEFVLYGDVAFESFKREIDKIPED